MATCWARSAANSSASARGTGPGPWRASSQSRTSRRTWVPTGVPPGSRVRTTWWPSSATSQDRTLSASVDLPAPSPPSITRKKPACGRRRSNGSPAPRRTASTTSARSPRPGRSSSRRKVTAPTTTARRPAAAITRPAPENAQARESVQRSVRSSIVPASSGPAATTTMSATRTAVCTKANVRPRTASVTSAPSRVEPVTQARPAKNPSVSTASADRTISGESPTTTRAAPAAAIEAPNSRRRLTSRRVRGPCQTPSAMPTNTAPKSTPYPGAPAPRPATYTTPSPTTVPPAAEAPTRPMTRPRTTGVCAMKAQPSTTCRHTDGCAVPAPGPPVTPDRTAAPRAASGRRIRAMTAAARRNVRPLAYSARSTSLSTFAANPADRSSRTLLSRTTAPNSSAAIGAVP